MSIVKTKLVHVCDFCGKNQDQVSHIVAGPGYDAGSDLNLPPVDICDVCVEAAYELVQERRAAKKAEATA